MSKKIQLISSSLIGTSTNCHANFNGDSRIMELTPWDLQFLTLKPNQKGILFHKPKTQDFNGESVSSLIHHLKNSLSRTLDLFPPLSGRLSSIPNPKDDTVCFFLDCNNAGVEFTHAVAGGVSISDILDPVYVPTEIVHSLFTLNGIANYEGVSNPLVGVQVTELSDGFFIGCTMNHCVADGTSFWHFLNSWSEISRGLTEISKPPVLERWFPSNVPNHNRLIPVPPPRTVDLNILKSPLKERVFGFSKESVANLKAKVNSETATTTDRKISTLQALLAHLWRSVNRARMQTNQISGTQEANIGILIGTRARIPLTDGYFGNAIHATVLYINSGDLVSHGLSWAASKINESVALQTSEEAVKFVRDWVEKPQLWGAGKLSFLVTSSPRFNVYGCDFGWGKPIAARTGMAQKFDGKITIFPAAQSGGIDVEACLSPETLEAMENDAEFMEPLTGSIS